MEPTKDKNCTTCQIYCDQHKSCEAFHRYEHSVCNNWTQKLKFEPKKQLSHYIDRIGYDNIPGCWPKLNHVFKFSTEQDLENVDYPFNLDIREILIDGLVQEFRFSLNSIVYGDPAGKAYVEMMEAEGHPVKRYKTKVLTPQTNCIINDDAIQFIWKFEKILGVKITESNKMLAVKCAITHVEGLMEDLLSFDNGLKEYYTNILNRLKEYKL